jgi:aminoglycoside phosphotransferase family enzyme
MTVVRRTKRRSRRPIRGNTRRQVDRYVAQASSNNSVHSHIVQKFLEILTAIRLYHWSTTSYAQHKTTEELYKSLESLVDRFVETLSGKLGSESKKGRIHMVSAKMRLYNFSNVNQLSTALFEFREFLLSLQDIFRNETDADILTIRDDMLAVINQYLYLLTMK